MRRPLPDSIPLLIAAGSLIGAALLVSGCNILGPVGYLVAGPEKYPAQYEIDPESTTVVFIDDRNSVMSSRSMRQIMAQSTEQFLLENKAFDVDMISSESIIPIATQERFTRPRSIVEVGKEVKADTVIYATVDAFTLFPNGAEFDPTAVLRVKVMDVKNGERLWPTGAQQWHTLEARYPPKSMDEPKSYSERMAAERKLAEYTGRELAKLFVKHLKNDRETRIGS